jgi:hypothetical protein
VKLLFLDINLRYMNPTRGLVPAVLRECAETVCYGPGYQPRHVLDKGLQAFYDLNGPFDFVIGNEASIFWDQPGVEDPWGLRNYSFTFEKQSLQAMLDIGPWFSRYRGRKIVLLLEFDAYFLAKREQTLLQETDGWYGVIWDRWLMESVKDSVDLAREPYAHRANDNFFEFVSTNEERIIALPHFVADSEFGWGALGDKDPLWHVPGASYHYRKLARKTLSREGILQTSLPWMQAYALLSRLGMRPFSRPMLLSLYGAQFVTAIERSRYCYTCGSAQHMHIRKHFEIPARGTVLVTAPVKGLEAMGFKDGINCFVRMPDELLDLHEELEREPERSQSVASAGRELIWSTHRVSSRGRQLRECLDSIMVTQFAGCVWDEGRWLVRTHQAA